MLTVCPKCTLTLAVTAGDLRIGQGYVRCGRCATVFNALLALSDASSLELPGNAAPPAPATPAATATMTASVASPTAAATAPASAEAEIHVNPSLADEPLDIVLEQTSAEVIKPPEVPAEVEIEVEIEAPQSTGTVQTIVMQGSSVSQSEEFVDIDTIDTEIAPATRLALEAEARQSIASLDTPAAEAAAPAPTAAAAPAEAARTVSPPETVETRVNETGSVYVHDQNSLYAPRLPAPKPPPSLMLWGTYAVLLVLILGAQAIHHWRNDLALRSDWIGESLTRLYAVLALPLTPNWDLHGYDVRQLGAATNGSGDNAIRVRISLANLATRTQAWPVLRLSLYNRYGKLVAARDLQPRDYLPGTRAGDLMPVGKQIESEVVVVDPGTDASSFELDVCVPAPHGLRCASDAPLRPAARS